MQDGATTFYRELGREAPPVEVICALGDGQWLAFKRPPENELRRYALETDTLGEIVGALGDPGQEELPAFSAPWLLRVRGVLDSSGQPVPQGAPVELEYTNVDTGEVKRIPSFPRPGVFGVRITCDGQWVFSGYYDVNAGSVPVVINADAGQRLDLPNESWIPAALSEARGTLLVLLLTDPDGDGSWRGRSWYEIPLQVLLARPGPQLLSVTANHGR